MNMRIRKKSSTFGELLRRTLKTENMKKKYFKTQDVSLPIKPDDEYSVHEVSSLLNLKAEVIRRYFRNGSLQGSKVNTKIVISGKALIAYLEKNNQQN